jgi:hypothetical protein
VGRPTPVPGVAFAIGSNPRVTHPCHHKTKMETPSARKDAFTAYRPSTYSSPLFWAYTRPWASSDTGV